MRVVVFTSGPLAPINSVFFERLRNDPAIELTGIVVDEYRRPRKSLWSRVARELREDGWAWIASKASAMAERLVLRAARAFYDSVHAPVAAETYEGFAQRTATPVFRVADIHADESLARIRALRPHVGLIVGTRILRDSVLSIPERGTLNIHKRKVPDYRGGGPVGYWEVLAGERSIGVTIHFATAQVDAGPVLRQLEIPIEECDTLESLRIKADVAGAQLYHEAVRDLALGRSEVAAQDRTAGRTFRAPSEAKVWLLERRLRRRARGRMPVLRAIPTWLVRARVALQYAAVLPLLVSMRRRLVERGQAPIAMLFYHVVANRAMNRMCLPLESFVRQVQFLRRYVDVVSLDDAVKRLRSGRNERVAFVLTFDDGYRDNVWAIEYLRYFEVPAAFFISAGHVRDGSGFEHDRLHGYREAPPMRVEDVRRLAAAGFTVGSHGVHHEDFASLDARGMEQVLWEGGELLASMLGRRTEHFSFPYGQHGHQVTSESVRLAQRHYRSVYSAYGGYNVPGVDLGHFLRIANPADTLSLATMMDGYTGFRSCLLGDGWGRRMWTRRSGGRAPSSPAAAEAP